MSTLLKFSPLFCHSVEYKCSLFSDSSLYAHYVFNTFDQDNSGSISFEVFYIVKINCLLGRAGGRGIEVMSYFPKSFYFSKTVDEATVWVIMGEFKNVFVRSVIVCRNLGNCYILIMISLSLFDRLLVHITKIQSN